MEVIEAKICLVPNSPILLEKKPKDNYGYAIDNVTGPQLCVQVVIWNEKCNNFSCHYDEYDKTRKSIGDYIPLEVLLGKKEGETVDLIFDGKIIRVTLCQLECKWNNEGEFEKTLYERTKSFGGICYGSTCFKINFSRITQVAFMIAAHVKCAMCYDFPVIEPSEFRCSSGYIEECKAQCL